MIKPPKKAVTRFFVPLIDVLILLFCIFLLMPYVSNPAGADPDTKGAPEAPLPTDVKELQEKLKDLTARLKEEERRVKDLERKVNARVTDRLAVRVLEIDPNTGVLFYYSDSNREVVESERDALHLIRKQKELAGKGGVVKDVFFLILLPRKVSRFPTVAQIDQIKQWFKDVPFGFDAPE